MSLHNNVARACPKCMAEYTANKTAMEASDAHSELLPFDCKCFDNTPLAGADAEQPAALCGGDKHRELEDMGVKETDKVEQHYPIVDVEDTDVEMETRLFEGKDDDAAEGAKKLALSPEDTANAGTTEEETPEAAVNAGTREEETHLIDDKVDGSKKVEAKAHQEKTSKRKGGTGQEMSESTANKRHKGDEEDTDVEMETKLFEGKEDAAKNVEKLELSPEATANADTTEEETYLIDDNVDGSKKVEAEARQEKTSERKDGTDQEMSESTANKKQKKDVTPYDTDSTVKRAQRIRDVVKMSDHHDANEGCSKCKEAFDTDTSLAESAGPHRLPFTCSKCFFYTLCGVCFDSLDWASFKCPICLNQEGFNKDKQVPNLLLCSFLFKQQQPNGVRIANDSSAATSVTPEADKTSSNGPDNGVQDPPISAPKDATRDGKVSNKTESTSTDEKASDHASSGKEVQAMQESEYHVGDRVYCQWPKTKTYFWGHIAATKKQPDGTTSYKVHFDDGDVLEDVDGMDFLTEEEFKEAGGTSSSKRSRSLSKRQSPEDEVKGNRRSTATSKLRLKSSDSSASAKSGSIEIWSGIPPEELQGGWPEGWTKKIFERVGGKSAGKPDPYWYSPIEKKKFRSMNEVRRFLVALEKFGDEEKAWEAFKR